MINVTYSLSPNNTLSLDLSGHACSVSSGVDPVCAAVSMLVYTLAAETENLEGEKLLRRKPHIILESGGAHISALPTLRGLSSAVQVFNMAMTGFELLARAYPQSINICSSEQRTGEKHEKLYS